jgi:hypothetical protein
MSRGKAFKSGLVCRAVAAFAVMGATAWAGEKIETSSRVVVMPGNVATNKTGKLEEPSEGVQRFQERINLNESRFGWQRQMPGARPAVGAAPAPAPVRRSAKDKKDDGNWLSAPADKALDYEAALGVGDMFQKPKASATSAASSGASSGTPSPDRAHPGQGSDTSLDPNASFSVPVQDYIRPDAAFGAQSTAFGLRGQAGSSQAAGFSPFPGTQLPTTALDAARDQERALTVDSILGRSTELSRSSGSALDTVLNPGASSAPGESRFETDVDAILRTYRPASVPEPIVAARPSLGLPSATSSLVLDDLLAKKPGGFDSLDSSRRVQTKIETPRGFLDPASRPPAVLPGPKFNGF